jgi:cystathionine beta-synthase
MRITKQQVLKFGNKFLKEKNPNIKIIGVDASGSILKGFHETGSINKDEIHPYQIEGMGKNLIPSALLFDKVDEFVRVNDEMSAYRTREIALKEAIMGGYTTGAVIQGLLQYANSYEFSKDDLVVAIFPDHGSRYITKVYSDQWMEEQGFINNCVHNYDEVFKTEIIK